MAGINLPELVTLTIDDPRNPGLGGGGAVTDPATGHDLFNPAPGLSVVDALRHASDMLADAVNADAEAQRMLQIAIAKGWVDAAWNALAAAAGTAMYAD